MDWKTLNTQVIAEFRANKGKVAQFGDLPVVILHTIGAKTGGLSALNPRLGFLVFKKVPATVSLT